MGVGMASDCRIAFYDVGRCGYYDGVSGNHAFGGLDEVCRELCSWSAGKPVKATLIAPASSNGGSVGTYMYSAHTQGSDYLFVIWNEVPQASAGKFALLDPGKVVGSAKTQVQSFGQNLIPGFPTYFWVCAKKKKLATVSVDASVSGKPAFEQYVAAFMQNQSWRANRVRSGADWRIEGYLPDKNSMPNSNVFPSFATRLCKKATDLDLLRENYELIRTVARKFSLSLNDDTQKSYWQTGLSLVGLGVHPTKQKKARFQSKVSVRISKVELETLIADFEQNHAADGFYDTGFRLEKEQSFVWLSKTVARGEFSIPTAYSSPGVVDGARLLAQLVGNRTEYESIMK
jgi:hypothetical protein